MVMKKREQLLRKILTLLLVVVMLMADSSVTAFGEVIGNVVEKGNKGEVRKTRTQTLMLFQMEVRRPFSVHKILRTILLELIILWSIF